MKKISLLIFLLLITSCISRREESNVTFWNSMGGPLGDALTHIIREYNEEINDGPPLIPVNMGSYGTLSQKIMGAVASRRPPVMAQVYESWTSELLDADRIVPIQRYLYLIPDSVWNDIFPAMRLDNMWDSIYITLPFNKSVPVYYYNMDLFEKYGIDHFPRTWDEFRDVAIKLTIDEDGDGNPDIYGTAFVVDVWTFATMLYQKGGRLIEGDSVMFDSKKGIETLKYWRDLIYKYKCAYLTTGYSHQDDFASGKVAMVWGTIVSYAFMKDKIKFRLGVAPVPHDSDSVVIISGTNVALFKDVPESLRIRAMDFIRYFLRPDVQAYWSIHTGYLPLRESVLQHPAMRKYFSEVPGMERAIRQVEHADFEPRNPVWFTGRRYLSTEGLEPALRGYVDPEVSLKRAAKLIRQEIIRRKSIRERLK